MLHVKVGSTKLILIYDTFTEDLLSLSRWFCQGLEINFLKNSE